MKTPEKEVYLISIKKIYYSDKIQRLQTVVRTQTRFFEGRETLEKGKMEIGLHELSAYPSELFIKFMEAQTQRSFA